MPEPPAPSWLDTLIPINRENPDSGFYVYVGEFIYGEHSCTNPIFYLNSSNIRFVHPSGGTMWVYNEENDSLESIAFVYTPGDSVDAASQLANLIGVSRNGYSVMNNSDLTKDDILYKASPL